MSQSIDRIVKSAVKIRFNINKALANRLFSIKMDCVTRLDRSILGINVQFCDKGKLQILTLAMKEVNVKQASENLADILISILRLYKLNIEQQIMQPIWFAWAAVYLDPRYQILLTDIQKIAARTHLNKIYGKMQRDEDSSELNFDQTDKADSDEEDIETILKEIGKNDQLISSQTGIADILHSFDNIKRLPQSSDILLYWETHPDKILKDLSQVVFSAPCTQVSVEKAFSTLKFILSDLRANIESDLLEDILLLNLNN